jgi:hypothetical protein
VHEPRDTPAEQAANGAEPRPLSPEERYPFVRPPVARLLVELDEQIEEIEAEARRAEEEFNRPRGIMGKLFGLRTRV